ncbi:LysR family transcriptional regulator [Mycolicibacterium sp. OfavD-34-C]|uniref:LysR family transcriptional regulator n=1 Tax=Mycolicibacterium sp. OfavD-34-C TaxID=2917746 RepID=UPI001EF64AA7|nr:LysR family transcriptional regulator [Mycolicibacterium sp. OfavD-34-C]MCG7582153.1 LysR family transcriptional regulator [Mycolicibacterium sp. OfavD-34-C]
MRDIERLRLVIAAARTGAISEAAREQNTSQPVLSRAIARVETDLGYKLFVREPTGVSLTGEAAAALARMRVIVEDYDALFQPCRHVPLRIGYAWAGLTPALETAVERWRAQHSEHVELLQFDDPIRALANLRIDLAIARKPAHRASGWADYITATPFAHESRVFAINSAHPLARREALGLDEVCTQMTLVVNSTSGSVPHDLWGHYVGAAVQAHNPGTWLEHIAAATDRFGVTSTTTAEFNIHPRVAYISGTDIPRAVIELLTSTPPSSQGRRFLEFADAYVAP